eukprot:CAMPEP_0113632328 /NCGR_PEP_ID=MMETSP0017_2-20120614/16802_1 /TAXON_ID=2856 /ORGANISM="Cylindrotheca closterium" /LENGTH=396 /DNA_ID=CAMNT_0000542877 /DNA_START=56 /DNA_END=1243 /DNA_ORIENTATION=+ /assembly_acc=CAM_ASM_000147
MTREDEQETQEIHSLLSEAMNTLTFEERQEQQEVLHGVDRDIGEEAIFIDKALRELDEHLILIRNGTVYELAETMNAGYVGARAFRIIFLRGNRYDAKTSANQMLNFFEMKQQLFGNEKLVKDITIDDLDEDDREALKLGIFRLAGRDTSNRQIMVGMPGLRNLRNLHVQNELRARFYTTMHALSSEQTQMKGVVTIMYTVGNFKDRSKGVGGLEHRRLKLSLPIHTAAFHFCLDDPEQYLLLKVALRAASAKSRARVKVHYGSHLECQYLLASYGISKELLPLTATYEVDMHRHLNWVESCVSGTNQTNVGEHPVPKTAVVTEPTANDVLYMGGDRSNNTGNVHLRNLVAEWSETYDDSETNEAKRRIVYEVIEEVHRSGGRFLNQEVVDGASVW